MRGGLTPCVVLLAACSGATTPGQGNSEAGAAPLTTCTIPDAGSCRTARALLSCQGSNGTLAGCVSDDLTQCPGPNPMPGVSFTCRNECKDGQYGAACGSVAGPFADPPAGCGGGSPTPGGVAYYCCACSP